MDPPEFKCFPYYEQGKLVNIHSSFIYNLSVSLLIPFPMITFNLSSLIYLEGGFQHFWWHRWLSDFLHYHILWCYLRYQLFHSYNPSFLLCERCMQSCVGTIYVCLFDIHQHQCDNLHHQHTWRWTNVSPYTHTFKYLYIKNYVTYIFKASCIPFWVMPFWHWIVLNL